MEYIIPRLTKEEIQSLQTDAALRMIGDLTSTIIDINCEMGLAISELGIARVRVERLKADRSTVVELMRALKVIVQGS